ncbi:hypothetical protein [Mycobacterium persicum]|uniref:hypothetical protein n=1 Tax=Mycobacterium persicum TaxID=1487726 RepID=UPI000A09D26F|nr:hypothetical protein [Mycobacterium persicum]ORC02965.1 hypothetical protein B1T48_18625 [Mycobacterium persicum]
MYADLRSDTNTYRPYRVMINGITRSVDGNGGIQVWVAAVQYGDGTLDQDVLDRPSVWIDAHQEALSSEQAS